MLIKLRLDEVIGQHALAYDVYDSQGHLIHLAGERLNEKTLKKMMPHGLFRMQEKLSLSWIVQDEMPHAKIQLMDLHQGLDEDLAELEAGCLFEPEEALPYLNSMRYFWQSLQAGKEIDDALLDVLQNQLISDVISRMGELQYLNQLRIRDGVTYSHTLDVTAVSIALGARLGLEGGELKSLALGALLHDLGKLYIPKAIMFKPTRLTDSEFAVMQLHPEIGYRIIREELKLPDEVARPALEHQELFAGGGYPNELCGDEIHPYSQIVKIADVYDALTSKRPYKESICSTKAIKIMLLEGAHSFNPYMLKTFLEVANYPDGIPPELQAY